MFYQVHPRIYPQTTPLTRQRSGGQFSSAGDALDEGLPRVSSLRSRDQIVELTGFDVVDPVLHLSASEQDRDTVGTSAVAYSDVPLGQGGDLNAGAVVAAETTSTPMDDGEV